MHAGIPPPPPVWVWRPPRMWTWRPVRCGPGDPKARPLNFPLGCGPGDLQGMLGYHPLETCKACWDTTCNACWNTPLWTEFLTHTTENITLPQTSFAGGNYYRPQMMLQKLFLHLSVSHSVHRVVSASVHAWILTPRQTPPWADIPLPSACWDTHPPPSACWDRHGYCCGRYVSYWKAFLFFYKKAKLFRQYKYCSLKN